MHHALSERRVPAPSVPEQAGSAVPRTSLALRVYSETIFSPGNRWGSVRSPDVAAGLPLDIYSYRTHFADDLVVRSWTPSEGASRPMISTIRRWGFSSPSAVVDLRQRKRKWNWWFGVNNVIMNRQCIVHKSIDVAGVWGRLVCGRWTDTRRDRD